MSLINKLKEDRITSFKLKDHVRKNLLGVLISEASKDNKEPEDSVVISSIKKLIKNCNEIINIDPLNSQGIKASIEKNILESYLPKQLTESEINDILSKIIVPNANISIGEVMRYFKENHEGTFDGSLVSKLTTKIFRG
jgi:hypothetical protein